MIEVQPLTPDFLHWLILPLGPEGLCLGWGGEGEVSIPHPLLEGGRVCWWFFFLVMCPPGIAFMLVNTLHTLFLPQHLMALSSLNLYIQCILHMLRTCPLFYVLLLIEMILPISRGCITWWAIINWPLVSYYSAGPPCCPVYFKAPTVIPCLWPSMLCFSKAHRPFALHTITTAYCYLLVINQIVGVRVHSCTKLSNN